MIYITGDTHGMTARLNHENLPNADTWKKGDMLIVSGDFGFLFNGGAREELFLRELSFRPYQILFVDGNRDNFRLLKQFPVTPFHGGQARKIRKNLFYLMRGQVYQLDGLKVFTMGGGYSIDRFRRHEGVDWWQEELPSAEEYQTARDNLSKAGMKVDCVISHAAPTSATEQICGEVDGERELGDFLEWVKTHVAYKTWFFGHLHIDAALDDNLYAMFLNVRDLSTGSVVW